MISLYRVLGSSKRIPEIMVASRRTPAWPQVLRRYLQVGSEPYPFTIPLRGGGAVTAGSVDEIQVFWHIFVRACYPVPSDCETILDAGANVGMFAIWAARQAPRARVISLEPSLDTFQRLQENIRRNQLEHRITALNVGLAGTSGERRMRAVDQSPNRSVILQDGPAVTEPAFTIQCVTLPEVLEQHQLSNLDLLKMDIEGSEWEVLLSTPASVLAAIRHIRLEYHEVNPALGYSTGKLFAHLETAGHRLTHREEDRYRTGIAFFERG